MDTQPTFTQPSPEISTARSAIMRLQNHFGDVVDPCSPTDELGCLAFTELTVEDVFPPYPPVLLGPDVGCDPRADLAAALAALLAASSAADNPREILRFAYAVRDLRVLEASPYLDSRCRAEHGGRA